MRKIFFISIEYIDTMTSIIINPIEYFKKKNPKNGEIIIKIINDLYSINNYENILFIRTPTTGGWLDQLFKNKNINRLLYPTKAPVKYYAKLNTIVDQKNIINFVHSLNKKFNLICIDSFHEYEESMRDLNLALSVLENNGIIMCHNCGPVDKSICTPSYKSGAWCGITYACFIEFAYNNPQFYYGVLDTDTGIGIISVTNLGFLSNTLNREKQKIFIDMIHSFDDNIYDYFRENGKDLINLINLF